MALWILTTYTYLAKECLKYQVLDITCLECKNMTLSILTLFSKVIKKEIKL